MSRVCRCLGVAHWVRLGFRVTMEFHLPRSSPPGMQTSEQSSAEIWSNWDLRGLLDQLAIPLAWSGTPALMTSMLFLALRDHGWDGSIGIFCPQDPELAASIEHHTCLVWKGQALDAFGRDHNQFAIAEGLTAPVAFRPVKPYETHARIGSHMPNVKQRIDARIQAVLLEATMDIAPSAGIRAKPRL